MQTNDDIINNDNINNNINKRFGSPIAPTLGYFIFLSFKFNFHSKLN